MGVSPQMGPPKFKLFYHSRYTHEIFRVGKYEEKIKFDLIWGYQNGGSTSNGAANILNF